MLAKTKRRLTSAELAAAAGHGGEFCFKAEFVGRTSIEVRWLRSKGELLVVEGAQPAISLARDFEAVRRYLETDDVGIILCVKIYSLQEVWALAEIEEEKEEVVH